MRHLLLLCLLLSTTPAHAGSRDAVRAFFDDFVARGNAFDPGVADLYLPEARIIILRDGEDRIEIPFADYRETFVLSMPTARAIGDTSRYENIAVELHGQGFRITATRHPAIHCAPDPNYHLDVVRVGRDWRIAEEYMETVTLSRCEPSPELAAALAATRARFASRLPLRVDDDTRLEGVEVRGRNLILSYWLPQVSPGSVDYSGLVRYLRANGLQSTCVHSPEMRALTEQGATVRLSYTDRRRNHLVDVDVAPGACAFLQTLRAAGAAPTG